MSSTPVEDVREVERVDAKITRAVRTLLAWHQLAPNGADLAEPLGASDDTIARRFKPTGKWEASEVAALAEFFGVPISDLYSGQINLAASVLQPHVRLSREHEDAGQEPFSGSDIEALVAANGRGQRAGAA